MPINRPCRDLHGTGNIPEGLTDFYATVECGGCGLSRRRQRHAGINACLNTLYVLSCNRNEVWIQLLRPNEQQPLPHILSDLTINNVTAGERTLQDAARVI